MGPLAAVERFLERLFERQSARLFRTAIRPVQVQRRLERSMEADRTRDGARTIVPHRFVVRLHPDNLAALRSTAPDLAPNLADSALAFARAHAYTLLDRPVVALRPDPAVDVGDIEVDASVDDPPGMEDGAASGHGPAPDDARPDVGAGSDPHDPAGGAPETFRVQPPHGDQTAVFVVPAVDGPHATIREIRPDRSSGTHTFDGRPLTIGRAVDNGLVLRDGRASRHHARIDGRRGSLVLTDLGSTNGSYVNDRRVESIALGEGDRIRIGTSTLVVEAIVAPAPAAPARVAAADAGATDRPVAD
ncbi:MAG: DUF3662 and FHA domain-containing protein [Chloroflexi bacterium]|nr:DUF3662 and FHA domain-containing protein [Chloroflexota bacterium]